MALKLSSRFLRILTISLVIMACLWGAGWHFLKSEVDRRLALFIEREALFGREWACENRQISGWALDLTLQCSSASIILRDMRFSSNSVSITTKIYNPFSISAKFHGLLQWQKQDDFGDIQFLSVSAHSSTLNVTIKNKMIAHGEISLEDAEIESASSFFLANLPKKLKKAQVTLLPSQDATSDVANIDLDVQGADWPLIAKSIKKEGLSDLYARISIEQVGSLRQRIALPELEEWWERQGRVFLYSTLTIKDQELLSLDGSFTLDDLRQPVGEFKVIMQGINLMDLLKKQADEAPGKQGDKEEPAKRQELIIKLQDGKIIWGFIKIRGISSLF